MIINNFNFDIKEQINSKYRFLITGGAGSIGSALVKYLLKNGNTVCVFDQDEEGLFRLSEELNSFNNSKLKLFLGNIRDKERLCKAMFGVDVVIHCAALKHVKLTEYNPFEAIQTNIEGTQNVIQAGLECQVGKLILTSSDKAVNPSSTMGASKLLSEKLFVSANHYSGKGNTIFSCVRFGNVLDTRGSVLRIFKKQIENKLPLTITSKKMSRFYITIDEAVKLCLSASHRMIGGEIFVLNMGAINIMTLVDVISEKQKINIKEIGVKPGEKLFEELVTETEKDRTVLSNDMYILLPETIDLFSDRIKKKYKKYFNFSNLNQNLRSDETELDYSQVKNILKKINFVS